MKGIHWCPVDPPHKGPEMQKVFPYYKPKKVMTHGQSHIISNTYVKSNENTWPKFKYAYDMIR